MEAMKPQKAVKTRSGKGKLPKHVLENIKHPALRQAWMIELTASQRMTSGKSLA
jgi:hypothetical protein